MIVARIRLCLPMLCVLVMSAARLWPVEQPVEAAVPTPALVWIVATPTAAPPTGLPVPTATEPQATPEIVTYVEVTPVPWIAPTEPAQVEPPPAWVNDPAQNGGNTPPDGCTFPIINGTCANGAQLADAADGARTNDRATRPHRIDPPQAQVEP